MSVGQAGRCLFVPDSQHGQRRFDTHPGLALDAITLVVQQDNEPLPADDEVGC